MFITVKTTSGFTPGPFNIYYDTVTPVTLLAANVTSASLSAGLNLSVFNGATSLIVVNIKPGCTNQQVLTLPAPPPLPAQCGLTGSAVYVP